MSKEAPMGTGDCKLCVRIEQRVSLAFGIGDEEEAKKFGRRKTEHVSKVHGLPDRPVHILGT